MDVLRKNQKSKPKNKFQVLFVCTGNSCRSPMAEGILKKLLSDEYKEKINVFSAGTGGFLNMPATYLAIEVAKENEVDIQYHRSQGITHYLMQKSNLILAMARDHEKYLKNNFSDHKEKIFLLKAFALENKNHIFPDILDPIGKSKEFYSKIYFEIELELERILPEILRLADKN